MKTVLVPRSSAVFFDAEEIGDLWQFIGEGDPIEAPETIEFGLPDGSAVRYGRLPDGDGE